MAILTQKLTIVGQLSQMIEMLIKLEHSDMMTQEVMAGRPIHVGQSTELIQNAGMFGCNVEELAPMW